MTAAPKRLFAPKRASIAAVLRSLGPNVDELLLIQRVASERDRWSAHVALPGGMVQRDESPLAAAMRECAEEVGLDLGPGGQFELVGQLDDRLATSSMAVSTFIFRARPDAALGRVPTRPVPDLKLQQKEVACAWWVPLAELRADAVVGMPIAAYPYLPRALGSRPWLVHALRMEIVRTSSIPMRWPPAAGTPVAGTPLSPTDAGRGYPTASEPFLWGLTFGVVNDLRCALSMSALVRPGLRPNVFYSPLLHPANAMICLFKLAFAWRYMVLRSQTLSALLSRRARASKP
jgi:8-oxo-dGTP pyrophosphatase MutT (NUDIX family)